RVRLPKAEIDNYIIRANLQHAEFLVQAEKRAWVTWHRKHNQAQVDLLSQTAHSRFQSGANALTEVPAWTENVKPAKSYDVSLEDKAPANEWLSGSINDFLADHKSDPELKEAFDQWKLNTASSYSYDQITSEGAYSSNKLSVVQTYLDQQKAKEEAEKLKPKYHTEPDPDSPANPPWTRV